MANVIIWIVVALVIFVVLLAIIAKFYQRATQEIGQNRSRRPQSCDRWRHHRHPVVSRNFQGQHADFEVEGGSK